jgi:hypothetical protein
MMARSVSHTPSAFRYIAEMGRHARTVVYAARAILALLMAFSLNGCDASEPQPDEEEHDRYARQYLPFDPEWISERLIPMAPPVAPQMVIWEVSEFGPEIVATPEQHKAGNDFVVRCLEAAIENGWFDRSKGVADGFLTPGSDDRHHRNDDYVLDDIQLDPERPEYLMYYPDPNRNGEQTLTGFMFLADGRDEQGHQFAGPLSVWHYHKYTNARCWAGRGLLSTGMIDDEGNCPTGGVPLHRSPEMVHVWLLDHPRGSFSTGMTLPDDVLRAGLAKRRAAIGY